MKGDSEKEPKSNGGKVVNCWRNNGDTPLSKGSWAVGA